MKNKLVKRLLTLVVAAIMLCTALVPAFAESGKVTPVGETGADSKSLIERIQNDDLQGMTDDAVAHLVAWATTNNPQQLAPELSRTIMKTSAFKSIANVYKMKQSYFFDVPGYTECVTNFLSKNVK